MMYDLLDTEGLYMGASSALNVVAAVELAQKLGPGMCDLTVVDVANFLSFTIARQNCRHNSLRRRVPVSESAVLEEMARG